MRHGRRIRFRGTSRRVRYAITGGLHRCRRYLTLAFNRANGLGQMLEEHILNERIFAKAFISNGHAIAFVGEQRCYRIRTVTAEEVHQVFRTNERQGHYEHVLVVQAFQ